MTVPRTSSSYRVTSPNTSASLSSGGSTIGGDSGPASAKPFEPFKPFTPSRPSLSMCMLSASSKQPSAADT
eukprot:6194158-Pleurochrysis_carterae.AAC.3